jgi:hypothetical protein
MGSLISGLTSAIGGGAVSGLGAAMGSGAIDGISSAAMPGSMGSTGGGMPSPGGGGIMGPTQGGGALGAQGASGGGLFGDMTEQERGEAMASMRQRQIQANGDRKSMGQAGLAGYQDMSQAPGGGGMQGLLSMMGQGQNRRR